jgi:ribosomal-protein-alanine N-acetyltransferase
MESGFIARRMTVADLPAVQRIEETAFESGWPATAFEHELTHNGAARYLLVERGPAVAAFGGLWLQFDQAHIVTVAVDPARRRQGLGRLVVHGLLNLAAAMYMADATLEVRESNAAARALYRGYGFYEVGLRPKYYADNGEAAVIMTCEPLTSPHYQRRLDALADELASKFGAATLASISGERLAQEPVSGAKISG